MDLKSKIALGLTALALTFSSGCPTENDKAPRNSPYIFYTKAKEIKHKFVDGENVDVRKALNYNPIPTGIGKALVNYLSSETKALETMRTIYVQYNINDSFPTFSGLEQAVASANTYSDPSEILVGEGTFGDGTKYVMPLQPIRITGSGEDKTTLRYTVIPFNEIELSQTRMEGAETYFAGRVNASLGVFFGGNIHNNTFNGNNGAIVLKPATDITFENNIIDSVDNPEYHISISFEDPIRTVTNGTLTMRYNTIRNTPIAIRLFKGADCGVQGDLGNNLFLDVGTVVYNPYNYPQGFVGNAWAETKP